MKRKRNQLHKKIKIGNRLPGADLTAEEADALRAHAAAFPGATQLVRGAWLVACAEAGRLLPVGGGGGGIGGGDGYGGGTGGSSAGGGAQAREQQRRGGASWSLSVSDLGALVRSASAAAVTNAAAAAAAAAAAVTGVAANGGNTAAGANGGGGAASAAAAAAASAAVASALPLAGLHFTLAAMTAPRPNGVSSNGSNGENAAATAALRTELAKAGARTFDARTTSGVPRDAAFALCPPGLSPEAAGILDRRADW